MKLSTEIKNGFIIFLGIGIYFLLMEYLGLSKYYLLRFLNVFIIVYGLNKTLKSNIKAGKNAYLSNLLSSGITGLIGIFLAIISLVLYINFKGGESYLNNLSETFLFGRNPSLAEYSFGLFIEGIASVLVVAYINLQYWNTKSVFKTD